ncbi:MAG: methionine--tRNA ligase [Candidatus Methanoliparum thermophilum]|uniref:Methionine--tRNA ligase n=1 Tax=Methanoliparum thermophilum TaxID=2491083 RepID=A0A520KRK2_METT2|nr:MAG: methionine--tRNA ligase [Candidatus Methanoliparum thermophilum]
MKVFIGVAWPYANSYLHLGHIAGAYLPASIFAKYQRLKGNDVLMVSGSDEHGTPIMVTAEKEGKKPSEVAKFYHRENSMVMEALDIGFDLFTETSTENHKRVVQDFLKKLIENGYTYEDFMDEPYCTNEDRFLPDRYVEGTCPYCGYESARGDQCDNCGKLLDPKDLIKPRCRICGGTPEIRQSKHLFFRLSALEKRLIDYIESIKRDLKPNVYNFTINFLRSGLKDRAITRDINWGIEVHLEGYEDKRIYVWFEAVLGYLSAAVEWGDWGRYWKDKDAKHYYFVGKDNIPFHTIIWPGMLIAHGGLKLPDNVPANEYLLASGEKLSKSRGISINVKDLLKVYEPDVIRYYLSSNMPEEKDSEFNFEDFISKNNNELVANLGNFVHRVLTFAKSNFGSVPSGFLELRVKEEIDKAFEDVQKSIDTFHFKEGIRRIMALSSFGNLYFYEKEPWKKIKEDKDECANTIYNAVQIVNALSILLAPYLPFTSRKIRRMLGIRDVDRFEFCEERKEDFTLEKPEILFKKIEDKKFSLEGIELVVGKIEEVKDHPQADKLYILKVNIGNEKRQIVAGLKDYLSAEELLGKSIVLVSNLKHAKLRGIESQGMLLAADAEKSNKVVLIHPENEKKPGTRVGVGYFGLKKSVGIEELKEKGLHVEKGRVLSFNIPLKTEDGAQIIAEIEDGAEIR